MDEERWKTIMNKRVFCELLMSTHPPQLFDINSCNLLVNLTFLVRTHLKVYPELQPMSFSIPSKATIVLFLEREAFSSVYNGHVGSETDH